MDKFQSGISGDVIMLAPAGDQMLTTIGMEPACKGIIQASQMSAAIRAIEQAIAAEELACPHSEATAAAEGRNPPSDEGVSLR